MKLIYYLKNGKLDEEEISINDISNKNLRLERPYTFKSIKQIIYLENIIYDEGKYDETFGGINSIKKFINNHNSPVYPSYNHTFYKFKSVEHNF